MTDGELSRPGKGFDLRDIILGGQDGLVNVLGLVLGVAGATADTRLVVISGLAATFAESISMAAVAYTSSKAARDHYRSELRREEHEIETVPAQERAEIRAIYRKKGFEGKLLNAVVDRITSDHKVWVETMMAEELHLHPQEWAHPLRNGIIVGVSSVVGSLIPLLPFFFLPVDAGIRAALILALAVLFGLGAAKARLTIGRWWKAGIELALIGGLAAIAGYIVGLLLGAAPL
jgi:VIT1/CCC1 family predicted Fe2+/Mn2+ transporter